MGRLLRTRRPAPAAVLIALTAIIGQAGCSEQAEGPPISTDTAPRRDQALAAARVWEQPTVPISAADFRSNPSGDLPLTPSDEAECRFSLREVGGTTPKFYCDLPSGESVKVKYGRGNPELAAEVAASRLLSALGFGADRMFVVRQVRCAGCPTYPFQSLRCFQRFGVRSACFAGRDAGAVTTFEPAVIERKRPGRTIEEFDGQGWAWYELDRIDPARGGATREEVDAFRLMAVFLAHWDNKPANQRLICPPGADLPDGGCARPLALMQDLGATFGPAKLDLHNWRQARIWMDPTRCTVSMKHLPWGGGTFPDAEISEGGRLMLLTLLEQLSDRQLRDLFDASGATTHDQVSAEARDAASWARAFTDKVRQIRDAGPCS